MNVRGREGGFAAKPQDKAAQVLKLRPGERHQQIATLYWPMEGADASSAASSFGSQPKRLAIVSFAAARCLMLKLRRCWPFRCLGNLALGHGPINWCRC